MRTCVRMTRPPSDIARVLELARMGKSASAVSRLTGIPRSTVRDWIGGHAARRAATAPVDLCSTCGGAAHAFDRLGAPYAYLLGMYLGDGCISEHRRRVYRLRIFLDARYPGIVGSCEEAMQAVMPGNKVGRQPHGSSFPAGGAGSTIQVSSYSRSWPCLFPQHGPGKKHERRIALAGWQRDVTHRHPEALIRGLIHSDGCRFMNTGRGGWRHPRYGFYNRSRDIRTIFCNVCDLLGVHWTLARDTVYVSRAADVARLDEFIGPKA